MYKFDQLDRKILAQMELDPRSSNQQMADDFGVTEGTIRQRLKKLMDNKVLSIRAISSIPGANPVTVVSYRIEAHPSQARELANAFVERKDTCFVLLAIGRFNVLVMSMCESMPAAQGLRDEISTMPGVEGVEMSISIKPVKFDFRWTRIRD